MSEPDKETDSAVGFWQIFKDDNGNVSTGNATSPYHKVPFPSQR